jgi:hypothetical protein
VSIPRVVGAEPEQVSAGGELAGFLVGDVPVLQHSIKQLHVGGELSMAAVHRRPGHSQTA